MLQKIALSLVLAACVQDDVVMGTLTVRENLSFSAALRLPSRFSYKQRKEKVDGVIEELGLTDCQHTKVPWWWWCARRYIGRGRGWVRWNGSERE